MAGRRMEVGFPATKTASSLRQQVARTTLRNVRMQGHSYVELREDGNRFIFFCTLCLAPCYSDSILSDHLKGNLHAERFNAAKVTLLGPNPWPFNDGFVFFDNSCEQTKQLEISNAKQDRLLDTHNKGNNLTIVEHSANGGNGDTNLGVQSNCDMVVPGVLQKDGVSSLPVRTVGYGQISALFFEKNGGSKEISKIWCEWLGKKNLDENIIMPQEHDFAVITFNYDYELGRRGLLDDVKLLLHSGPSSEIENAEGNTGKRKRSLSEPEDISDSLKKQCDSSEEDSRGSNTNSSLTLERYHDELLDARIISSKTVRRELRRQQRVASERMCGICQQKMLPSKSVATLVNLKTKRLCCSSRNDNGIFHVFHVSCLIHWILLCEYEILMNESSPRVKGRSRRKCASKCNAEEKKSDKGVEEIQIYSAFCPECQGTGVDIEGHDFEKPRVPLSQMFRYKIKAIDARRAWMKSPEMLKNCSTGFHFPSRTEGIVQETVALLKLLHFYEANA